MIVECTECHNEYYQEQLVVNEGDHTMTDRCPNCNNDKFIYFPDKAYTEKVNTVQAKPEERTIYNIKQNEIITVKTKGDSYPTTWAATRVEGGWIYTEHNPRIERTPMVCFVPYKEEFKK